MESLKLTRGFWFFRYFWFLTWLDWLELIPTNRQDLELCEKNQKRRRLEPWNSKMWKVQKKVVLTSPPIPPGKRLHHQLKGRGYDGSKNRSKISERRKNRFFNPCSYGLKILKKPDLTGTQSKPITVLYLLFNSIFMVVMYISLYMGVWAYFLWTHISPERRIPPCEQILQRH